MDIKEKNKVSKTIKKLVITGSFSETTTYFNKQGRVVLEVTAKDKDDDVINSYHYDTNGNLLSIVNVNGVSNNGFDAIYSSDNLLKHVKKSSGEENYFEYDDCGRISMFVTNIPGKSYTATYKKINGIIVLKKEFTDKNYTEVIRYIDGHPECVIDYKNSNGATVNRTFDSNCNLVTESNDNGINITYHIYDNNGNLSNIYSDDKSATEHWFEYDCNNNLVKYTGSNGLSYVSTYNDRNDIISRVDNHGGKVNYEYTYFDK